MQPHSTTISTDLVGFLLLKLSIPPPEENMVRLGRKFLFGSTEESCEVGEKKFEGQLTFGVEESRVREIELTLS